jgi:hypothetical protein
VGQTGAGSIDVPPLKDPDRLAAYLDALANWKFEGCVSFDKLSKEGAKYLRELGVKQRELKELMHEYVAGGGEIYEVREKNEDYVKKYGYEYHHDLRFTINSRQVIVETRLDYRLPVKPFEATIFVVNVHDK